MATHDGTRKSGTRLDRLGRMGRRLAVHVFLCLVVAWAGMSIGPPAPAHAASTPAHVQGADGFVSTGTTVSQSFTAATTAGNLIVAYVVWDNTGTATVSDNRGNVYASAGEGATHWNGPGNDYSAQAFYAKNIAGGATTVTATFSQAASSFAILYVHEYSGLDPIAPLDATATATGSSGAMDSGSVTTSYSDVLLVGAGASIGSVTAAGSGYTARSFAHTNIVEDRVVSAGTYSATATQNSDNWVMQAVAFKAEGAEDPNSCELPNYPTPDCTGVPPGTTLTTHVGNYVADTDDEVIDSLHITGALLIEAENVLIKNSLIDGTVYNPDVLTGSFTIMDSTIGPAAGCTTDYLEFAIGYSNFTAKRVLTRGFENAFSGAQPGNILIEDSYNIGCQPNTPDPHSDGIQLVCEDVANFGLCDNIVLDHNTFDGRGVPKYNGAIYIVNPNVRNVTVTDNLLMGGGYSLYLQHHAGPNWNVSGNKIVANSYAYAPVSTEGTCAYMNWGSGNATVTIDGNYQITGTVASFPTCLDYFPKESIAPSVPTNLQYATPAPSQIQLTWDASTDNYGIVTGYKVFRDGNEIADVQDGTSYLDTGLVGGAPYSYTVLAYDPAGNESAPSAALIASTS